MFAKNVITVDGGSSGRLINRNNSRSSCWSSSAGPRIIKTAAETTGEKNRAKNIILERSDEKRDKTERKSRKVRKNCNPIYGRKRHNRISRKKGLAENSIFGCSLHFLYIN